MGLECPNFPKGIKKDELVILGHREKLVVVSFFIVDNDRHMRGRVQNIPLGRLPLREGKTLHMFAWKEPQGDLMDEVRKVFPNASKVFTELGHDDGDYTMWVQGFRGPNSAFMVVFPVRYTSPESEDIIRDTSVRRRKAMEAPGRRGHCCAPSTRRLRAQDLPAARQ